MFWWYYMSASLFNVFNACVFLLVIFRVLWNGLILIPYTRRKIICAKRITGRLMYWPLFLRYLKEVCRISWLLTLSLYWIIRYLLIELVTVASTWFYISLNFGANPFIKGIVLELWQWIRQMPLIACHMDSQLLSCLHMAYLKMRVI